MLAKNAYQQQLHTLYAETMKSFTEHPTLTGETYGQHLWFTIKISLRFIFISIVLLIHGVFPFLFTHTASRQIERVYTIMKNRIPEHRRKPVNDAYAFDI